MARVRALGLRRLRATLVAFTLSYCSLVPRGSEAALAPNTCGQGFVQHDPIALGCQGGKNSIKFELTEAGSPHHLLLWQAPAGTSNLVVNAMLSPPKGSGGYGRAALKVACSADGKVLVGSDSGFLNRNRDHGKIEGAHWQWGRDSWSSYGETFEEWFRVNGTLPCDVDVSLSNEHSTRLAGEINYEWRDISPCPDVLLGCRPCSQEQAACSDRGLVAFCDGSPFVQCMSEAAFKVKDAAERVRGCCFTVYMQQGESVVDPEWMTKGECDELRGDDNRGYVAGTSQLKIVSKGWHTTCPKDAAEARSWAPEPKDLGRTADVLHPLAKKPPPPMDLPATTTTMAALLPTTSLVVPMTNELEGAFALELQTDMDVTSPEFRELLLVALAESIGVHRIAFERFKVVDLAKVNIEQRRLQTADNLAESVGFHKGAFERFEFVNFAMLEVQRRLQSYDAQRQSQVAEAVQAVEAQTGSKIIGVGYRVAAGSAEREHEIQRRLDAMDGASSHVRASLHNILVGQGVRLVAVQVTYKASVVAQRIAPAPTEAPGGVPAVPAPAPIADAKARPVPVSAGIMFGLASACALVVVILMACQCLSVCRDRLKSKSALADSGSRLNRDPQGAEVSSSLRKRDGSAAPATRYVPVRSEDLPGGGAPSFTPSVASDSSEAAGLRLLGNDGM